MITDYATLFMPFKKEVAELEHMLASRGSNKHDDWVEEIKTHLHSIKAEADNLLAKINKDRPFLIPNNPIGKAIWRMIEENKQQIWHANAEFDFERAAILVGENRKLQTALDIFQ